MGHRGRFAPPARNRPGRPALRRVTLADDPVPCGRTPSRRFHECRDCGSRVRNSPRGRARVVRRLLPSSGPPCRRRPARRGGRDRGGGGTGHEGSSAVAAAADRQRISCRAIVNARAATAVSRSRRHHRAARAGPNRIGGRGPNDRGRLRHLAPNREGEPHVRHRRDRDRGRLFCVSVPDPLRPGACVMAPADIFGLAVVLLFGLCHLALQNC